ncbi:hypothetical protein AcV5_002926 [Taiwanofungus camphoratus]|nr:hypothetical protein AcV5_002926 [Antrodia cinnamomea]
MSNKRPRLDSTSRFLDIEAQVNEHNSDSSKKEEDETDFIDHGTIDPEYSEMRRLVSREVLKESAEALTQQLVERYRHTSRAMFRWWAEESLPSHTLLPTLNDPFLWIINVKPGMEKDAFQHILNSSFTPSCRFTIISIFMLPGVVSHLYVEAATIQGALLDVMGSCLANRKYTVVPLEERATLLKMRYSRHNVPSDSWVRVRRGRYKGDLAYVTSVDNESDAELWVVPRLSTHAWQKRKQGKCGKRDRPAPALFDIQETQRIHGDNAVLASSGKYTFH